ncbi:MAG: DUF1732 domain-containing protein [Raineya sp.]|nr:YicC family protein [Raineya sp.]MDW8296843.1 DUF1732 domain-containing protein [Raineya sp.]
MLQSMTGYGKAQSEQNGYQIEVEIKTLNSKFLDVSLRMPKELNEKELEIRALLQEHLERGKVSLTINFQRPAHLQTANLDEKTISAYYQNLLEISQKLGATVPNLFELAVEIAEKNQQTTMQTLNEEEWLWLKETFLQALERCKEFRLHEGAVIRDKLREYAQNIQNALQEIEKQDRNRLEYIKQKLQSRLQEVLGDENFDRNRLEQEMIFYTERLDITEEKVRLQKHIDYLLEVLADKNSNGKKINFISQEMGREINTIGSKANDAIIQRWVVVMKEELEKIKEQSMNVL